MCVRLRAHTPCIQVEGARFHGTGDVGGHELGNMGAGTKLLGRATRTLNNRALIEQMYGKHLINI